MAAQLTYAFSGDVVIIRNAVGYNPNDLSKTWDFYNENGEIVEMVPIQEGIEIQFISEPVDASSDEE